MPIHMQWYDTGETILLLDVERRWTYAEFQAVMQEMLPMLASSTQAAAVIVNFQRGSLALSNLLGNFSGSDTSTADYDMNFEQMVMVGQGRALKSLLGMYERTFGQPQIPIHFATTLDEALEQIATYRARHSSRN